MLNTQIQEQNKTMRMLNDMNKHLDYLQQNKRYQIVDTQTGFIKATYKEWKYANNLLNKLDKELDGYKYRLQTVIE